MNISIKNILAYQIVILTVISVNPWTAFPIGNTFTSWLLYFVIILSLFRAIKPYYLKTAKKELLYVKLFLGWVIICFVRGLFIADFYWDYKNLLNVTFALLLPSGIFVLMNPMVLQHIFTKWIKYALPLFLVFIIFTNPISYGYFLVPISILALFLPALSKKWRWIVIAILIFVILSSLGARSNVIKFIVPLFLSFLYYKKKWLKIVLFNKAYKIVFFLPVLLVVLAIFNVFNIFKMDDYIIGEYTTTSVNKDVTTIESLTADTRTLLFMEVIESAVKNNYVFLGRTPARGYDSKSFGIQIEEETDTGRKERYGSEVSILNVFTWFGVVGVILYFLVFFKAVTLAISHSNNVYIKLVGLYVLIRWLYAWVEDFNNFSIMNVMLWTVVAMCYSPAFRAMSDKEFIFWVRGIFDKRYRTVYTNKIIRKG